MLFKHQGNDILRNTQKQTQDNTLDYLLPCQSIFILMESMYIIKYNYVNSSDIDATQGYKVSILFEKIINSIKLHNHNANHKLLNQT